MHFFRDYSNDFHQAVILIQGKKNNHSILNEKMDSQEIFNFSISESDFLLMTRWLFFDTVPLNGSRLQCACAAYV